VNKAPLTRSHSSVTLGLLLNSDHADVVLDTGPPADSSEVSSYLFLLACTLCIVVNGEDSTEGQWLSVLLVCPLCIIVNV